LTSCTLASSSAQPIGRSSTTGGVVCPAGYEQGARGSCQPLPNRTLDHEQR
jgi:hypothetical protein